MVTLTHERQNKQGVLKYGKDLIRMLWPLRLSSLGISLMAFAFPFVGMFYLMVGNGTYPRITRGLYLIFLAMCCHGLLHNFRKVSIEVTHLDWVMLLFFLLGAVAYLRAGFPGISFEYFLSLNVVAFFAGRVLSGHFNDKKNITKTFPRKFQMH